jgi:phospholipid N-methyltransferase
MNQVESSSLGINDYLASGVTWAKECAFTVKDNVFFIARYFFSESAVGSLMPSNSKLADRIVAQIPVPSSTPRRYLEVGPGTGPVTERLVSLLGPNDVLDLVEYDVAFCESLKEKYLGDRRVTVIHASILEWDSDQKYDAIISTVPFNLFTPAQVQQCFNKYLKMMKEKASLSYIEVAFLRTFNKVRLNVYDFFWGTSHAAAFEDILGVKENFFSKYGVNKELVWTPPQSSYVFHCKV